jgi:protein HOOK3
MTETELEKHTSIVTDLTRKVEELQGQAELAIKLKDQVDE